MKLIVASNNAHKLAELRALLAPLPVELIAQGALGIDEADEPHGTFVENALAKARQAARAGAAASIADDSGLCVDALGGAPGVASAHFAPRPMSNAVSKDKGDREALRAAQDAANNALLLARLQDHSERRARYVACLVALRSADDPEPLIATGRWDGVVLCEPRGQGGFGYDPLVLIPSFDASVAELPPDVKNAHSHRALAARRMLSLMREVWRLG